MDDNLGHSQSRSNTNDDTLNFNGTFTDEEALKCALEMSLSNQVENLESGFKNNNKEDKKRNTNNNDNNDRNEKKEFTQSD